MDFQQQQYAIDVLVQRVRTGRLALPDFQREFVWNPSRVVELIDSVSRQWPIGSLLLLSGPQPFAIRPIDSGPAVPDEELDLYILDGQQRVTSLFHAVADVSEFCYYVDFNALARDDDDYISWERRSVFENHYPGVAARAHAQLALVKDVWDLQSFYKWLECVPDESKRAECVGLRDSKLPGLHAKVYKVMAIVLDQAIELEALARIFETLNRTGVALNAFDLMVATLYPSGFRLRDEWESAQEDCMQILRMEPDEIEPLKLIALLVRANLGKKVSRGVRQGDLLRLDRAEIRRNWPMAITLFEKALAYCNERFGVTTNGLVPSWAMVLGVAGWLHFGRADDATIRAWWLDRLVTQYFSQAANTRIVSEFDAIAQYRSGEPVWAVNQPISAMGIPAKTNGVLMRGLGALLVDRGATDLLTSQPLRESRRVAFRAVSDEGAIRRLKSTDLLDSIVLISEESDKKLGKSCDLADLGASALSALAIQGIEAPTWRRTQKSSEALLGRALGGPLQ